MPKINIERNEDGSVTICESHEKCATFVTIPHGQLQWIGVVLSEAHRHNGNSEEHNLRCIAHEATNKASTLEVQVKNLTKIIDDVNFQAVGNLIGVDVGQDVAPRILPAIIDFIENARKQKAKA